MIKSIKNRGMQAMAFILALCLGLGLFAIQPVAASQPAGVPVISAQPATMQLNATNREVSLVFEMSQNPGLALLAIDVTWNESQLSNVSFAGSSAVLPFVNAQFISDNVRRVNYFSFAGNSTANGELFTLTATVADNVQMGQIEIGLTIESINNQLVEGGFTPVLHNGIINITAPSPGAPFIAPAAAETSLAVNATDREVELVFSMTQNPGLAVGWVDVSWNASELTNVTIEGHSDALPFYNVQTLSGNALRVNFFSFTGNHTTNGPLFTVTATVADGVSVGQILLDVVAEMGNELHNPIFVPTVTNGVIHVTAAVPASVAVTAAGGATSVQTGNTLQFSAAVAPAGVSQAVTWTVSGHANAMVNSAGLLNTTGVPAGTVLTVTATATGTTVSGNATVTVTEVPVVTPVPTSVNVTANATVQAGGDLTATAVVLPQGAPQAVTWSVNNVAGVSINQNGVLTVGANVPNNTQIIITATATGTSVSGTATVTVQAAQQAVTPTGVTLTVAGGASSVQQTRTLQFSASVQPATAPQAITWTVTGHAGATINANGLLSVGANVPVGTVLTITATATGTSVSATRTVSVTAAPQQQQPPVQQPPGQQPPTGGPQQQPGARPPAAPPVVEADDDNDNDNDNDNDVVDVPVAPPQSDETFRGSFVVGYPGGNFMPGNNITRAEAAVLMVRTLLPAGASSANIAGRFTDVSAVDWYFGYLAQAYANNLIQGFPDGSFKPNQTITREEFAVLLARTTTVTPGTSLPFTDAANISGWAVNYVNTVLLRNWMHGDAAGTFRPHAFITRAEATAAVSRVLGRGDTTTQSIAGVANVQRFPDVSAGAWYFYYVVEASNCHWFAVVNGSHVWTRVVN